MGAPDGIPSAHDQQSLDQACVELHRMVDAFRARWLQGHAANPEHYPAAMADVDWFEAFLSCATSGEGL